MFNTYEIADFFAHESVQNQHFHINRLEEMPLLPTRINSPHKHLFYEVFLILKGKAIHNIDYTEYVICPGSLFFISQGQLHLWSKAHRTGIRGFRLMFTDEFLLVNSIDKNFLFELVFLDNVYFAPNIMLAKSEIERMQIFFNLLFQEYQRPTPNNKVLQHLLFLTLHEIQRTAKEHRPLAASSELAVYKKFVELLEAHLKMHWPVSAYASRLYLSEKQFSRVIRNVTNQSVSEIIRNRITLEAKRLLTSTDLNINQVSDSLGFDDVAYFARYFKRETAHSPTEFRNLIHKKYPRMS